MTSKCWNTVVMLALATTTAVAQRSSTIPVDTAAMDAHLRFLSSDLLEGRAPATRGGRIAAEYIAAQFEALGLEPAGTNGRSEEHTSELQSQSNLVCRLLLEKKKKKIQKFR